MRPILLSSCALLAVFGGTASAREPGLVVTPSKHRAGDAFTVAYAGKGTLPAGRSYVYDFFSGADVYGVRDCARAIFARRVGGRSANVRFVVRPRNDGFTSLYGYDAFCAGPATVRLYRGTQNGDGTYARGRLVGSVDVVIDPRR